jgi:hypothetical protein
MAESAIETVLLRGEGGGRSVRTSRIDSGVNTYVRRLLRLMSSTLGDLPCMLCSMFHLVPERLEGGVTAPRVGFRDLRHLGFRDLRCHRLRLLRSSLHLPATTTRRERREGRSPPLRLGDVGRAGGSHRGDLQGLPWRLPASGEVTPTLRLDGSHLPRGQPVKGIPEQTVLVRVPERLHRPPATLPVSPRLDRR